MSEISKPTIENSWQRALEILRNWQSDNQSAARCVAALEILYRKLNKDPQLTLHGEPDLAPGAQVAGDEFNRQALEPQISAPDIVANYPPVFGDIEIDYFSFLTDPTWVTDFQRNM